MGFPHVSHPCLFDLFLLQQSFESLSTVRYVRPLFAARALWPNPLFGIDDCPTFIIVLGTVLAYTLGFLGILIKKREVINPRRVFVQSRTRFISCKATRLTNSDCQGRFAGSLGRPHFIVSADQYLICFANHLSLTT